MTLIEGVGDEVTDFFIVVGVLLVGWIAWCSTNISEQPLIRTVLILQHRTRTRIAELRASSQPARTDNRVRGTLETNTEPQVASNTSSDQTTEQTCPEENATAQEVPAESDTASSATPANAASEEVIIQAMDSIDENVCLLHRPAKLSTAEATSASKSPETNDNVKENTVDEGDEITIKLKFINDDQKVVSGRLKEMLGDFKRRHFQMELDEQKRVRLVFNGQVLQPDNETLEKCGLYNNCVVHCLVHQPRIAPTSSTQSSSSNVTDGPSIYSSPQAFSNATDDGVSSTHNEWDLSRLLVSILTLILALAWYSRYHYAQLFTATTTLALYALTAIFTLSVVGHFFPDQDSLRNIE